LVQELVAAGADIEARDKDGKTPLIKAIYAQNKKLVKLLLDANADVSQLDQDGVHPTIALIAGTRSELQDIAQQFEEYGIDGLAKFKYFDHPDDDYAKMDTAMLQVLLGLGADISEMNYEGIGILHYAVIRNNKDLVKFLLDAGADATYKDSGGNTPAAWASVLGYGKIAKLLRTAEADQKKV
jgi:ankyrin repeat protein